MKILYGINGVGNGHIIKSLNIIDKLKEKGIDVDILISGTNHSINIDAKYKLHGFSFYYTKDGSIDYLKTALNLKPLRFINDIKLDVDSYDKVITDFEPITSWACKLQKKDCIGVSHQYSFLSKNTPRCKKSIMGEIILNKFAPVTQPIGLHFNEYDTFIKQGVIRQDILNSTPIESNHYTVYLPSYDTKSILSELNKYSENFEVFCKVDKIITVQNITLYPSSINNFMKSFTRCKGIITSAGFETPSEALYMKKKLMVIPIKGQYEQLCNAKSLSDMNVLVGNIGDISKIFDTDKIQYNWNNPIDYILESIMK